MIENLDALILLFIVRTNFRYNWANSVDVISENDATHGFYKDHAQSLALVGGHDIPKANGQHDGSRPIVAPYVDFKPARILKTFDDNPIMFKVKMSHWYKQNRQAMSNNEIEKENFYQWPYLSSILIFNERKLNVWK